MTEIQQNYALVNGLKLYYEIHGSGKPLVLLHGGFMTISALGPMLPLLAQNRQVIAIELEGHGHTADLDRPLRVEQMTEDVAGLLQQLGISHADFVGYSMGGVVALGVGIHHPALVNRLVLVSAPYNKSGYYPSIVSSWPQMSAAGFAGTAMEQVYHQTAPDPKHWSIFVEKMKESLINQQGWTDEQVKTVKSPALIILGDNDLMLPEFAFKMFQLLGGAGGDGGMGAHPASQLAILPNTNHFGIFYRTDLLVPIITPFLDPPEKPAPDPLL